MPDLKSPVLVLGAGKSGLAVCELLATLGKKVLLSTNQPIPANDQVRLKARGVRFEQSHTTRYLKEAKLVVTSPGIRPASPILKQVHKRRLQVVSELDFAASLLTGPWVAVTGTNGKSTTTALVHQIWNRKHTADLCGNNDLALSESILKLGRHCRRVVEVSSFQLHYAQWLKPSVAAILNLKPNHLDWHKDLHEYYSDKLKIMKNLSHAKTLIVNADDETLSKHVKNSKLLVRYSRKPLKDGVFEEGGILYHAHNHKYKMLAQVQNSKLIGPHNIENMLAAAAIALCLKLPVASIRYAIENFKPLAHRLEDVGTACNVRFINDSKATTVESTQAALESFSGKLVLLAGGKAKERHFERISPTLKRKVHFLVLYGDAGNLIAQQCEDFPKKQVVKHFETAVRCAFKHAQPFGTVLLSPMCASFDQFSSFEARGEAFKSVFRKLRDGSDT